MVAGVPCEIALKTPRAGEPPASCGSSSAGPCPAGPSAAAGVGVVRAAPCVASNPVAVIVSRLGMNPRDAGPFQWLAEAIRESSAGVRFCAWRWNCSRATRALSFALAARCSTSITPRLCTATHSRIISSTRAMSCRLRHCRSASPETRETRSCSRMCVRHARQYAKASRRLRRSADAEK